MTTRSTTRKTLTHLLRHGVMGAMLLAGGCVLPGEGSRELELEPQSKNIRYLEDFSEAYAAPSPDGGYDLVLSDGFMSHPRQEAGLIFPSAGRRVSQVVHMHIAWRPERGSKSNYPAATNATFHWYVLAGEPAGSQGIAEYSGIGFVKVELDETDTLFDLQNMTIHLSGRFGAVKDPLGPTRVSGQIRAQNNVPVARSILEQLQQQIAAATPPATTQPTTEPSGMPPARRMGP